MVKRTFVVGVKVRLIVRAGLILGFELKERVESGVKYRVRVRMRKIRIIIRILIRLRVRAREGLEVVVRIFF